MTIRTDENGIVEVLGHAHHFAHHALRGTSSTASVGTRWEVIGQDTSGDDGLTVDIAYNGGEGDDGKNRTKIRNHRLRRQLLQMIDFQRVEFVFIF